MGGQRCNDRPGRQLDSRPPPTPKRETFSDVGLLFHGQFLPPKRIETIRFEEWRIARRLRISAKTIGNLDFQIDPE